MMDDVVYINPQQVGDMMVVRCTCSPMGPTAAGGRHNQGCPLDHPEGQSITVVLGETGQFDWQALARLRNGASY